jgi:CRP/FNR family transcriptional regulator
LHALRDRCANCSMHELCLPMGLDHEELQRLDGIIKKRRRLLKNDYLYRMGDKFQNLYAIRVGHFKTVHTDVAGTEQVTGFQMAGELLGFDAISTDQHQCSSVALEDGEVCEVPFDRLEELFRDIPSLQRHFHRMMSQEITREQSVMLLLGNMRAEQRLAAFLVNLSTRYSQRGYSPHAFQLRMTREEIGSYLGLTIESISRLLTRFKNNGWMHVEHKEIDIIDLPALKNLVTSVPHQPPSF